MSKPAIHDGDPWRRPMFRGNSDDHFAYAGWDDPIHEVHALVERGVHGRGMTDDGPVSAAEHKRLEGQQKRDLVIHQRSAEWNDKMAEQAERNRQRVSAYRQRRGPTLTAEEREQRRLARREQKLVDELKALGYIVFKRE